MNRREFVALLGEAVAAAPLVADLMASVASGDAQPLAEIQTTHAVDRAIAAAVDHGSIQYLKTWLDEDNEVLRVNAAGILAKLPGQGEAQAVVAALQHDVAVRDRYSIAVVARVCGLSWGESVRLYREPLSVRYPSLVAQRFAQEAMTAPDAGARWCSAAMIQALSPALGR